jgi:hypothetical protein
VDSQLFVQFFSGFRHDVIFLAGHISGVTGIPNKVFLALSCFVYADLFSVGGL